MSRRKHEDWTIAALNVASPGSEVVQEWAIPRNARRIDSVHQWDDAPESFGVLQPLLSMRTVLFEHESSTLNERKWWRFQIAFAYLASVWCEPASLDEQQLWDVLHRNPSHRRPALVVLAESLSPSLLCGVPQLSETSMPGVWWDGDEETLSTIVVDRSRLAFGPGVGLWHFLLGPSSDARYDVLRALREDPAITNQLRTTLEEAIMNQTIPTDERTRVGLATQIREEGRSEGRKEALKEKREVALQLASVFVPEHLDELNGIEDVEQLIERIAALKGTR